MSAMAQGDRAALRTLYNRHASNMLGLGLRILGNREDAEDVLSEVFFEIWQKAGRYDSSRGRVRPYLLLLMRSRSLDRSRTRSNRPDQRFKDAGSKYHNSASPEASPDEHAAEVRPEAAEAGNEDTMSGEAGGEDPELARLREALLRTRAEMDNVEKRAQREIDKARRFALERMVTDLLPVLDSLDQALDHASGDDGNEESVLEGTRLTRKLLLRVMEQHGVEIIDPEGESFDPSWHEAMTTQPSAEHPPQTVVQVLQKGFKLNERLLRPARVIVSTATVDDEGTA